MCHALLQDPSFFRFLLHLDADLAGQTRAAGCACGGVLHRADYPRKPRGCLSELRAEYQSRFSFCCDRCRRRWTAPSVRFLGRRVYLGLAVVLVSARHAGSAAARVSDAVAVPLRTVMRWRRWWQEQFALTPLWQAACARFLPPLETGRLPANLLERFGAGGEALRRLLVFLTPLSIRDPITLREGR